MVDTLIPAEALRHVPGCESGEPPRAVTPMLERAVNRLYRVDTASGAFVLRLSAGADAWLQPDRSVEYALQGAAAAARLAPRIHYSDPVRGWLVMDYVAGGTWCAEDFGVVTQLEQLGRALGVLHSLPVPPLGRFDIVATLDGYARRLEASWPELRGVVTARLSSARAAWQIVLAAGRAPTIVHHDVHASNLIRAADRTVLIDWECAVIADPLLDVACVCAYYPMARAESSALLSASGLGHVTAEELDAAIHVFEVHSWFWYRERRMRWNATAAEVAAEQRLDRALSRLSS